MGTNARDVDVLARAIAAELRAEQARQNVTLRALAERAGIPHSTLSKSLNELRVLDVEEFAKVCAALGIEPAVIFARAQATIVPSDGDKGDTANSATITPLRPGGPSVGAAAEDDDHPYEDEARAAKKRSTRPAETLDDNLP